MKMVWHCHRIRRTEQRNSIENPETELHKGAWLVLAKVVAFGPATLWEFVMAEVEN